MIYIDFSLNTEYSGNSILVNSNTNFPYRAHPTVNDELPNRIAAGTVRIKPQISQFTERGLEFEDGTKVDEVDTVIFATGYSFEFPILERGELVKVDIQFKPRWIAIFQVKENMVDLFLNIFPLSCEHDTLGIIGLIQVLKTQQPNNRSLHFSPSDA